MHVCTRMRTQRKCNVCCLWRSCSPQIDTEQLIKEIISRNCGWGGREDRAAPAKETFLVDNCHISAVWFEEAKVGQFCRFVGVRVVLVASLI